MRRAWVWPGLYFATLLGVTALSCWAHWAQKRTNEILRAQCVEECVPVHCLPGDE